MSPMGNNAVDLDEAEYDEAHAEAKCGMGAFLVDMCTSVAVCSCVVLGCAIACAEDRRNGRVCCGNRRYRLVCLRVHLGYRLPSKHGNAVA